MYDQPASSVFGGPSRGGCSAQSLKPEVGESLLDLCRSETSLVDGFPEPEGLTEQCADLSRPVTKHLEAAALFQSIEVEGGNDEVTV